MPIAAENTAGVALISLVFISSAIRMARIEMAKGSDAELKSLAGDILDAQAREIVALNAHRRKQFGAASPAGGVPRGASSTARATPADGCEAKLPAFSVRAQGPVSSV